MPWKSYCLLYKISDNAIIKKKMINDQRKNSFHPLTKTLIRIVSFPVAAIQYLAKGKGL